MQQKRYWLRGGIIGLIIGVLFLVINFLGMKYFNTEALNWPLLPGIFSGIVFNYLVLKCDFIDWNNKNPQYCDSLQGISMIAFNLLAYFIVGMLIG
jgi:hypothetical protein